MRSRYEVEDRKNVYKSRDKRLLRRGGFVENLIGCRRDHLDIFGNERSAFDIFDEFRLDLVGQNLADARVPCAWGCRPSSRTSRTSGRIPPPCPWSRENHRCAESCPSLRGVLAP